MFLVWDSEGVCEREDSIVEDLFQAADKDDGFSDSECSRGRKRKRGGRSRKSKKGKKKSTSSSESESEEESRSSHSESDDEDSVTLVALHFIATKKTYDLIALSLCLFVTFVKPSTALLPNTLYGTFGWFRFPIRGDFGLRLRKSQRRSRKARARATRSRARKIRRIRKEKRRKQMLRGRSVWTKKRSND